jgi:hypothetical protein
MPKQIKQTRQMSLRLSVGEFADWKLIRRQCNATVGGATRAAMVSREVCAQLHAAGFGNPPPPMRVLLGNRPGAVPAIREGVGHGILKNLADENSRKVGEAMAAGG